MLNSLPCFSDMCITKPLLFSLSSLSRAYPRPRSCHIEVCRESGRSDRRSSRPRCDKVALSVGPWSSFYGSTHTPWTHVPCTMYLLLHGRGDGLTLAERPGRPRSWTHGSYFWRCDTRIEISDQERGWVYGEGVAYTGIQISWQEKIGDYGLYIQQHSPGELLSTFK